MWICMCETDGNQPFQLVPVWMTECERNGCARIYFITIWGNQREMETDAIWYIQIQIHTTYDIPMVWTIDNGHLYSTAPHTDLHNIIICDNDLCHMLAAVVAVAVVVVVVVMILMVEWWRWHHWQTPCKHKIDRNNDFSGLQMMCMKFCDRIASNVPCII